MTVVIQSPPTGAVAPCTLEQAVTQLFENGDAYSKLSVTDVLPSHLHAAHEISSDVFDFYSSTKKELVGKGVKLTSAQEVWLMACHHIFNACREAYLNLICAFDKINPGHNLRSRIDETRSRHFVRISRVPVIAEKTESVPFALSLRFHEKLAGNALCVVGPQLRMAAPHQLHKSWGKTLAPEYEPTPWTIEFFGTLAE